MGNPSSSYLILLFHPLISSSYLILLFHPIISSFYFILDDPSAIVDNDLGTLDVVSNLANVLYRQGQLQEARELWKRAQRGYESMVGGYHFDTLRTMSNVANVLNAQGELVRFIR